MNLLVTNLYISAFLYLAMGAVAAYSGLVLIMIPFFAIALLVGWCAKSIERGSSRAVLIGMVLMVWYVTSPFLPLGLIGLYGFYRDRKIWSAWE